MNKSLLAKCIEEDYGLTGTGRWFHAREHDSLVFDSERDLFWWNSKGLQGTVYEYLTKVRCWSFQQAKEFLKVSGFTATFIHEVKDGTEVVVYPRLVDVFHDNLWEVDRSYFYNRLITDETIKRFQLGFYNNYFTIPIFQDGTLKQIQLRRDSPKLITNFYSGVGPLLFNSDVMKFTNKIILTEGIISSILLAQSGLPAVSMNIGAEGFQPEWIRLFQNQREVLCIFDRDTAGDKGSIRVAKILGVDRVKIYNLFDFETPKYALDDALLDGYSVEQIMERAEQGAKYAYEMDTPDRKTSQNFKHVRRY